MTLVYLSVFLVALMPLVCTGIAKSGFKAYDNHDPRAWLARQTGHRARANAAQSNCLEAFPVFAVGVVLALHAGVPASTLGPVCGVFVLLRAGYIYCYVTDRATWRTLVWLLGFGLSVALYVLALLH